MAYVDGFILAVPTAKIDAYKDMARLGGTVWMDHGALSYVETIAEDTPWGDLTSIPRAVLATDDEVVIFSWVTYRDRAHRDAVMAKVMADPHLKGDSTDMPFDGKRMIMGGFETFVEL